MNKLKELEKTLLSENFWKDKSKVKKTVKEKKIYEDILNSFKSSTNEKPVELLGIIKICLMYYSIITLFSRLSLESVEFSTVLVLIVTVVPSSVM